MVYNVVLQRRVIKMLETIRDPDYTKIKNAIMGLSRNPRPMGYKKLKGRNGYRIRIGDYRIIYEVFDNILTVDVIHMGHRKDVYE